MLEFIRNGEGGEGILMKLGQRAPELLSNTLQRRMIHYASVLMLSCDPLSLCVGVRTAFGVFGPLISNNGSLASATGEGNSSWTKSGTRLAGLDDEDDVDFDRSKYWVVQSLEPP